MRDAIAPKTLSAFTVCTVTFSPLYRLPELLHRNVYIWVLCLSGVSRDFLEGGGSTNSVEDSKTFLVFVNLRLFMMTTNLFVIANVKKLRT